MTSVTMRTAAAISGAFVLSLAVSACGGGHENGGETPPAAVPDGTEIVVSAAPRAAVLNAAGIVEPYAEATLSTRLMGSVLEVLVQEGETVREGQMLLRIDARDLEAQRAQVEAGRAEAEAVMAESELNLQRMRALFADGAAPRAQLDAAETAHARARAAVETARAGAEQLAATASYAALRAPFSGTVVRRMVDPGSFAAPGTPLLTIQDVARLRISVSAAPRAVAGLERGARLAAVIEGETVPATIEGVIPGAAGLFTINAIASNADGRLPGTGAATLALPQGERTMLVVPLTAVRRQGDLTGVLLRTDSGVLTRWVRLGPAMGDSVEIISGLRDGDRIIIPAEPSGAEG